MDISDADYKKRLGEYQYDLQFSAIDVVQKHILTGSAAALDNTDYYQLRRRVAEKFRVQSVEVILVGSCRVGFSIVDKAVIGRPRYSLMRSDSDLDLAIVSATLFDTVWDKVFRYSESDRAFGNSDAATDFRNGLFEGWIDPKGLPPISQFAMAKEWNQFFGQIGGDRKYGNRRASARLYRTWDRLISYQQIAVKQCQRDIKG